MAIRVSRYIDAVMPLLNPNTIHFNKRCIAVEEIESGRLLLRFSDGTFHETDLVIGADGIKSTIRTAVLPPNTRHLAFSGSYAYRALIPMDILMAEGIKADIKHRPYCWVGKNKHIITLPIKNNTVLNIVALYNISGGDMIPELPQPWVESASEQEVIDRFSDWGRDSRAILKHMKQPTKWSIHTTYPPLKNYVKGKIVLIGDAAHAMVPHLGAGAGQGFEDTYALCRLLAHPTVHKANLEDALKIYNEIRPPRASMVLERSIRMGRIYENYGPGLYDIPEMVQKLTGMWEPVWNFDLETQISRALQYFDKLKQKL
ncbi:Salicylate hydroxylase [Psilocybe cubensis]|nr:Salicylate hydroxylase [Psilocybe cubensis]KAH9486379.1 Salicylate hydroxylase [Psilocybe cubensis]